VDSWVDGRKQMRLLCQYGRAESRIIKSCMEGCTVPWRIQDWIQQNLRWIWSYQCL